MLSAPSTPGSEALKPLGISLPRPRLTRSRILPDDQHVWIRHALLSHHSSPRCRQSHRHTQDQRLWKSMSLADDVRHPQPDGCTGVVTRWLYPTLYETRERNMYKQAAKVMNDAISCLARDRRVEKPSLYAMIVTGSSKFAFSPRQIGPSSNRGGLP